ncbi:MAG: carboxypeptidase-like regulatory domain-containing protein [Planctomycetia bacterium]|nr:carboxypeptidase-like regulatory domain-containing protein [Planctomycetia bacterium]
MAGRVTLDGNAVVGASVLVQPAAGPAARGLTDAAGRFALGTYGEGDGVIPGPAVVSISCYERASVAATSSGEPPLGKNLLPARYADPAMSGLRAVIEPGMAPLEFLLSSE